MALLFHIRCHARFVATLPNPDLDHNPAQSQKSQASQGVEVSTLVPLKLGCRRISDCGVGWQGPGELSGGSGLGSVKM